jgi:hypothetical protein
VHTIPEVEEKTARILQSLRYGTWAEDLYRFEPDDPDIGPEGEFGVPMAD